MKLGDLVYYITYYTGIRWVVKKIWGEDCGCDERQRKLNEWTDIDLDLWKQNTENNGNNSRQRLQAN